MKKMLNFRPLVILGLSLVLGGYFWYYLFSSALASVCFCVLAAVILVSVLVSGLLKQYKLFKKLLCLVLIPFVIGVSVVSLHESWVISQKVESAKANISGEVETVYTNNNGEISSVVLDDVIIKTSNGEKIKLRGNVVVDVSYALGRENIVVGDKLALYGSYNHYYSEDNFASNVVKAAKGYSGKLYQYGNYSIIKGKGIKYKFTSFVRDSLYENMDSESASVAYAMIFGDKSTIETERRDNFSASGLAHVLAVSGLHVGFIATLFGFLIGLIIKNKYAKTGIMGILLLAYCYLCGFSASVVRATVMSIVMMLAGARGEQYDGLSALGFSACVNFAINPLCIFGAGFMLSYTVVFAIFALGSPLKFLLNKFMPSKMASSLSVSLAAWVGSMPLLIYLFGEISFFSIVFNMLMVPYVGIVFMSMCLVLMLSWVPGLNFLYVIPNFLYKILIIVVDGVADLKYMLLELSGSLAALVFLIIAILLASDYIFHKRKYLYSSLFVLCFLIVILVVAIV